MRPVRSSPAHHTDLFAELVCSNSLKSDDPTRAAGVLKRELARMGSLIIDLAREHGVPAGGALAVDRGSFARAVTRRLEHHPRVAVDRVEARSIPDRGPVIVATGPLTDGSLAEHLRELTGSERLSFFDAAAPILETDSLDMTRLFAASRYEKGEAAYLNAGLGEPGYLRFRESLVAAERVQRRDFETDDLFQACLPIEELARRGIDAMRFGPLKPVGLTDPLTGKRPHAVVQLRAENAAGTAYNMVGFQTNLTFAEQRRVFSLIPGLENAEFLRYGVMHRNTFIDAPRVLDRDLSLRSRPDVFVAGQLTGTEGYLEAAGTGLVASLNALARLRGLEPVVLPQTSVLGALLAYATVTSTRDYQPMHVNYGLVPPLDPPVRGKRRRYATYSERALDSLDEYVRARADLFPASVREVADG
jgi:methylenetetrahydrofolate--tRNA-(uracil-5-)-methyltransferase